MSQGNGTLASPRKPTSLDFERRASLFLLFVEPEDSPSRYETSQKIFHRFCVAKRDVAIRKFTRVKRESSGFSSSETRDWRLKDGSK